MLIIILALVILFSFVECDRLLANFTIPGNYSFTVPADVKFIRVLLLGGGGGGGGYIYSGSVFAGGSGGYTSCILYDQKSLNIIVAGGGKSGFQSTNVGGYGGGGNGRSANSNGYWAIPGGGGRSAVRFDFAGPDIATAGGGGGGGAYRSSSSSGNRGGSCGGGKAGCSAISGSPVVGTSGNQVSPGYSSRGGGAGSQYQGGDGAMWGAGGGGGYYGGGGGGFLDNNVGNGGGGSGYINRCLDGSYTTSGASGSGIAATTVTGLSSATAEDRTYFSLLAGIGGGGSLNGAIAPDQGGDGQVIILSLDVESNSTATNATALLNLPDFYSFTPSYAGYSTKLPVTIQPFLTISLFMQTTSPGPLVTLSRWPIPSKIATDGEFTFKVDNAGYLCFFDYSIARGTALMVRSALPVNTGTRVHVAFVKDERAGTLFINGVASGSAYSAANESVIAYGSSNLWIGKDYYNGDAGSLNFTGVLDHIEIHSAAFSSLKIQYIFNTSQYASPVPSTAPSFKPTKIPSFKPSIAPTKPSYAPQFAPTYQPATAPPNPAYLAAIPVLELYASALLNPIDNNDGMAVTSWGPFTQQSSSQPRLRASGGPNFGNAVQARRSDQYLSTATGSRLTFRMASNGGITVGILVRFEDTTTGIEQTIVDFANGPLTENIAFLRQGVSQEISFRVYDASGTGASWSLTTSSTANRPAIRVGEWATFIATISSDGSIGALYKNGRRMAATFTKTSAGLTDRTTYSNYLFKSNRPTGIGFNGASLSALLVYDYYWDVNKMDILHQKLSKASICPLGTFSSTGRPPCWSCPTNTYSYSLGSKTCTDCPLNATSQGGVSTCTCPNNMNAYCTGHRLQCLPRLQSNTTAIFQNRTIAANLNAVSCPTGYHFEPTIPGCYMAVKNTALSWYAAVNYCETRQGWLVTINSLKEHQLVSHLMSANSWAGATDEMELFVWRWEHGQSNFTKFAAGEPNNAGGNEKCLQAYALGSWNDLDCVSNLHFLCEANIIQRLSNATGTCYDLTLRPTVQPTSPSPTPAIVLNCTYPFYRTSTASPCSILCFCFGELVYLPVIASLVGVYVLSSAICYRHNSLGGFVVLLLLVIDTSLDAAYLLSQPFYHIGFFISTAALIFAPIAYLYFRLCVSVGIPTRFLVPYPSYYFYPLSLMWLKRDPKGASVLPLVCGKPILVRSDGSLQFVAACCWIPLGILQGLSLVVFYPLWVILNSAFYILWFMVLSIAYKLKLTCLQPIWQLVIYQQNGDTHRVTDDNELYMYEFITAVLLVHALVQALPQLALQVTNNVLMSTPLAWSTIAIASITSSALVVLLTVMLMAVVGGCMGQHIPTVLHNLNLTIPYSCCKTPTRSYKVAIVSEDEKEDDQPAFKRPTAPRVEMMNSDSMRSFKDLPQSRKAFLVNNDLAIEDYEDDEEPIVSIVAPKYAVHEAPAPNSSAKSSKLTTTSDDDKPQERPREISLSSKLYDFDAEDEEDEDFTAAASAIPKYSAHDTAEKKPSGEKTQQQVTNNDDKDIQAPPKRAIQPDILTDFDDDLE